MAQQEAVKSRLLEEKNQKNLQEISRSVGFYPPYIVPVPSSTVIESSSPGMTTLPENFNYQPNSCVYSDFNYYNPMRNNQSYYSYPSDAYQQYNHNTYQVNNHVSYNIYSSDNSALNQYNALYNQHYSPVSNYEFEKTSTVLNEQSHTSTPPTAQPNLIDVPQVSSTGSNSPQGNIPASMTPGKIIFYLSLISCRY